MVHFVWPLMFLRAYECLFGERRECLFVNVAQKSPTKLYLHWSSAVIRTAQSGAAEITSARRQNLLNII